MTSIQKTLGERFISAHDVLLDPSPVVEVLQVGGMVIMPTDTLYGLMVRCDDERALEQLFRLKGRAIDQKVPILMENPRVYLEKYVEKIPRQAQQLMDTCWPGPLTLVFKSHKDLPRLLVGPDRTIGVRNAAHPVLQAVLSELALPVTGTSANLSGGHSPFRLDQISSHLLKEVDLVVDGGELPGRKGSTVIDFSGKEMRILRQGDLPLTRIREILQLT